MTATNSTYQRLVGQAARQNLDYLPTLRETPSIRYGGSSNPHSWWATRQPPEGPAEGALFYRLLDADDFVARYHS